LYPNPAANQIVVVNTIKAENIVISDMTGKTMFTIQQPAAGAQQIDISNLPAGNYLVKAMGASVLQTAYFSKL
jgi:hypothetical protein